jgi:hypothetical protein
VSEREKEGRAALDLFSSRLFELCLRALCRDNNGGSIVSLVSRAPGGRSRAKDETRAKGQERKTSKSRSTGKVESEVNSEDQPRWA